MKTSQQGIKEHPLYRVWWGMKDRCYNRKNVSFTNYGGNGITMCEDWKSNFMSFYNWAISNGWEVNLTIDRIDVLGNYEPNNCQWLTRNANSKKMKTLDRKRRNTKVFDHKMLEEIRHYDSLVRFFGDSDYIDGEYPFYVNDSDLSKELIVKKRVHRNGKRTTRNIPPVSLNSLEGKLLITQHLVKYFAIDNQDENTFITYCLDNWDSILTRKQQNYLTDHINGEDHKYSRQLCYMYRTNIQRRLKKVFIGVGGDVLSPYMISQYRRQVDMVNKFDQLADDNEQFTLFLMKKLDKEYVNQIVYEKLTCNSRQNIVDLYFGKVDKLDIQTLNEFYEHILKDKERFHDMGIS